MKGLYNKRIILLRACTITGLHDEEKFSLREEALCCKIDDTFNITRQINSGTQKCRY